MMKVAKFEDIEVGDESTPLQIPPLTRTMIVRYAGASHDFNPNHHDEEYALANGNKAVFAMGMLPAGFCGRLLTDWFGHESLSRLRLRFVSRFWPGDELTCIARVTNKNFDENGRQIECEFESRNQNNEPVIRGDATIRFETAD